MAVGAFEAIELSMELGTFVNSFFLPFLSTLFLPSLSSFFLHRPQQLVLSAHKPMAIATMPIITATMIGAAEAPLCVISSVTDSC